MGLGVVSWRGERAGQVCYLRRGATGPAGVRTGRLWQAPCLARCGSVSRTGRPLLPLREGPWRPCGEPSERFFLVSLLSALSRGALEARRGRRGARVPIGVLKKMLSMEGWERAEIPMIRECSYTDKP